MFIFSRSIAGPLIALTVSALIVALDALFTTARDDRKSCAEAAKSPPRCLRGGRCGTSASRAECDGE